MNQRLAIVLLAWCLALQHTGATQPAQPFEFNPNALLADVRAYYDFGVHRTAHEGDRRTSDWLAARFRALGLDTSEQSWRLRQFFLQDASIETRDGQRIDAFPLWLPRASGPAGLRARLITVNESTPPVEIAGAIAWLQSEAGPAAPAWQALEARAISSGAAGIVFATSDRGGTGMLVAQNAEREHVDTERPVPTLTFGSRDADRMRQAVGQEVTLRLSGRMDDNATARNIVGRVVRKGGEARDWIVVSTPSSGWFTCAGERGPGIALLLALAEWAVKRPDGLNYLFVATSGHELDFLGARLFHEANLAPPPERTRAWLHLGASIATPPWREVDGTLQPTAQVTAGTLQASEEFAAVMRAAFADLPMYTLRTDTRIGEFRDLIEHGYRGLGIVGGSNPWFHVERDGPETVSASTLAAVGRATVRTLEEVERAAAGQAAAGREAPASITATRLAQNPLITLTSSRSLGDNVNGPAVIRVPPWIERPLGRYYMYFAHHLGAYLRLAYADRVEGPWKVHEPGVLPVASTAFYRPQPDPPENLENFYTHVASPEVFADVDRQRLVLWFHGWFTEGQRWPIGEQAARAWAKQRGYGQFTQVAESADGLAFEPGSSITRSSYLRVFAYDGYLYGVARLGQLLRSRDPLGVFEGGVNLFRGGPYAGRVRHVALLRRDEMLYVFFTAIGDDPERVMVSTVTLTGNWNSWRASEAVEVLRPEAGYECPQLPSAPSAAGDVKGPVRQMRDPAILEDGGRTFLFYSVCGEQGIAAAEVTIH